MHTGDEVQQKAVLLPVWDKKEPDFLILEKLKPILPPDKNPWRVVPDDKHVQVHKLAGTRDCLVSVYPDAIAMGSPYGRNRKGLGWFAVIIAATAGLLFLWNAIDIAFFSEEVDVFGLAFCLVFSIIFSLIGAWFFNFSVRMPSDWPIIFNRAKRTISFVRPTRPKFFRFWEFTNSGVCTYPWDEVKVRSYKLLVSNAGKSFHDSYWMVLLWGMKDEHGRNVVKDCVPIGYEGYFEDERLFQVWEHIRRYMEEGGPPIQPGERLRKPANNRKPAEFPPEVIAAAGGPALSEAEVERLAGIEAGVQQEEPSEASA